MVGEMTYEHNGAGALDYLVCNYGQQRLHFRGPERSLTQPYAVFVGSTETYGKFVARPFPALVEDMIGLTSVNLGVINAGVETFRSDPAVLEIARKAEYVVLQAMGPQFVSNGFYSVHPRRNDRFIRATAALQQLYPSLDFTQFHFVGHLLAQLKRGSRRNYEKVAAECRRAWLTSMVTLIRRIDRPTLVLWMPQTRADPLLNERLLQPIQKRCAQVVEVPLFHDGQDDRTAGMVFAPMEAFAARDLPNPLMHAAIAQKVAEAARSNGLV